MDRTLIQLRIHPHKVVEQKENEDNFKPWICSGNKINQNQCKNTNLAAQKITNKSIQKYICEKKCANFLICSTCVQDLQDVAILPEQVEHPLHTKHPLIRLYNQDDSWICDAQDYLGCLNNNNNNQNTTDGNQIVRYNCKLCDFDLCSKCVFFYLDNPSLTYLHQVHSTIHDHVMVRQFDDNGWSCDGSKNNTNGCLSGITGFGQTTNLNRWRCSKCDFDLCEKCLQATIIDACPLQKPPSKQQYTILLESIQKNNNQKLIN